MIHLEKLRPFLGETLIRGCCLGVVNKFFSVESFIYPMTP
jgi:hypothetical protein